MCLREWLSAIHPIRTAIDITAIRLVITVPVWVLEFIQVSATAKAGPTVAGIPVAEDGTMVAANDISAAEDGDTTAV
ncbi:hypothetical protein [Methylomonas sp. MgM2]